MATFPYTSNAGRVKEVLQKIQDLGVPTKVTNRYLESLGYRSKNDRAIVTVLRTLGFIDASGVPTETWRRYRNKAQSKAVMATVLRSLYRELFNTYPDAYRRDNEALRNFFSGHTTVGEGALKFMVATFKSLAELGDFKSQDVELLDEEGGGEEGVEDELDSGAQVPKRRVRRAGGVIVNLNIQLQIPETEKAEVYDSFFAAMKKHLLE